jgi:hypothetical protein
MEWKYKYVFSGGNFTPKLKNYDTVYSLNEFNEIRLRWLDDSTLSGHICEKNIELVSKEEVMEIILGD